MTVRCHQIWSISLVLDCVTDSINLQSGLRQQWTGSQLVPREVTCVLCPPKPAFSTHPQIISVVQTCEAQEPLIAPKRVSGKSISVLGHTWLSFIKSTAPFFKHFRIGETPVLDISNLEELPGFTEEPVVIWRSQVCLWTMGYVSEKLGVWCFLRTAIRSLKNRGDIRR